MADFDFAQRLKRLPPYLFVEIDRAKRQARQEGRDIIDLGIGDPDSPTPAFIIDALNKAAQDGSNHHYALDAGMSELRKAIANWYQQRFKVNLEPDCEILPLIGSKEGIAHLPLGIINPGDRVLVPDPAYPPYRSATIFAGGKVELMPLRFKHNFLPDLNRISGRKTKKQPKLLFINYPNNPTAAVASREFLERLVNLAREKNIIVTSDAAYSEIYFDQQKPISILEIAGAKEVAVEFHSLSKTYNMTGWRIGWACGNRQIISALAKVKTNIDSGVFQAIQLAGIAALESGDSHPEAMRRIYQERRDYLMNGLRGIGWKIPSPLATFYVWAKIPKRFKDSIETAKVFLEQANIVITPGVGFGKFGEGFVRLALTVSKDRLLEAVERLKKVL